MWMAIAFVCAVDPDPDSGGVGRGSYHRSMQALPLRKKGGGRYIRVAVLGRETVAVWGVQIRNSPRLHGEGIPIIRAKH